MIVGSRLDADAAGLCDALKPSRDIDTISEDVMRLDYYVADIDADTKGNAPVLHISNRTFLDELLDLHSGADRFKGARKLRQEPITIVFDNAAPVFPNRRVERSVRSTVNFACVPYSSLCISRE
jgi:hypothetical protein